MRFTITTLGCKVNTAESEVLAGELVKAGWQPAADGEAAELCIVNSCTVTGRASMQSRQAIRRLRRLHPDAKLVVIGCYAQTEPEAVLATGGVSAVLGSRDKTRLVGLLPSIQDGPSSAAIIPPDRFAPSHLERPGTLPEGGRSRPFLKIQDGCDSRCTYCIVPRARGPSRSLDPGLAMEALMAFGRAGYQEVVLTGIHLGAYGKDLSHQVDLLHLMDRIENERPVARVRLSSIEPNELADDWLERIACGTVICPHLHLPLQSGDSRVLERMGRPCSPARFRDRVLRVRDRLPDAAIGTDVMVGFPGESEAAFANTLETIAALPLTYLHVFPFSPRKGTLAHSYPERLPSGVLKERSDRLRKLGLQKRRAFMEAQVGRVQEVLVERRRDRRTGKLKGISANYQVVLMDGDDDLINRIVRVRAKSVLGGRWLLADPLPTP